MQRILFLVAAALSIVSPAGFAAAITITPTQELAFGSIIAGVGGTITVGVNPAGRTTSGGAAVLPSSTWTAATFQVTGDPSLSYAITLPSNGTVALSSGANSMSINDFTSNPPASGTLSAGGSQVVRVGASLNVGSNQPTGNYTGTFSVTVDYN